ncbi:MAG TPA: MFS transporter [Candidatus Dormibacteraeota bacterium]|nr:MFS transporter [Candidatus Dormibacteraeota bacterium]
MPVEPNRTDLHQKIFSASRKVLILLCVMYALTYIDRNNVSTAAFVFKKELHLTNTEVGLVFSAFAYPYLIFQIIGGWVSDKFGARLSLTICAIIWGTATSLTGMANGLAAILCARVMLGFGEGATFPTATRAMSDWVPSEKRAFAQGITHSSARLGNALTPPLVAWLIAVVTWRGSFIILGIISLAWAVAWGLYFRDDPGSHSAITVQELQSLPCYAAKQQWTKKRVPWLSLTRRMLPVTAVYFCYAWTLWLYLAWIPSFFLQRYGLKLQDSALFSAGVFFSGVLGNTLGGIVSDRILSRTGSRNKARRNVVVAGFLCSLASMMPLLFSHNLSRAAICLSLAFFFSEFTIGPLWAIPMDIAPRFAGSASGLMNSGTAFAAIISPLVFGYVIDKTGNWELPFIGSIGMFLLGSILAFWMKPEEGLVGAELTDVATLNKATVEC